MHAKRLIKIKCYDALSKTHTQGNLNCIKRNILPHLSGTFEERAKRISLKH